ncbi:two-component system activity regulator YycH [Alicyclobacillus sp.]|uniref:two-component system activity regulator YycH n=1 Tax=Alicyclobacillus sp. TaxID=61169 RepID=UPI0025BBF20D|nr:two-component system activity regulator YycH [Alicyclobacillus sp.]MCL6516029.1 hypothetical protein [Alicyclobacillus sp.]
MTRSRIKSVVLLLLVCISVALSYLLWSGRLQQTGEVVYGEADGLTNAEDPQPETALSPVRWVLTAAKPQGVHVAVAGGAEFSQWQRLLAGVRVENLHPIAGVPAANGWTARVEFGTALPFRLLSAWVPGLNSLGLLGKARDITLYVPPGGRTVRLWMSGGAVLYGADTDLDPQAFQRAIENAAAEPAWVDWNADTDSFIPGAGQPMRTFRVHRENAPLLPLVHTFFVNPMALTRMDENDHTVLWTDGTRVVSWDKRENTLSYTDPNPPQPSEDSDPDPGDVLQFIRGHGGTEDFSRLDDSDVTGAVASYQFHPYVDGYPVLTANAASQLEIQGGHVVSYRRPVANLSNPVSDGTVTVMGAPALKAILQKLMPNTPVGTLTVRLGYALTGAAAKDGMRLQPAYFVSQSGLPLWVIDAVNGRVLQGMSGS